MSGWEKVAAATVVALIGLLGLNLAIWRRVRAAVRLAPHVQDQRERDVHSQDIDLDHPPAESAVPVDLDRRRFVQQGQADV